MILGERAGAVEQAGDDGWLTIDALFRRHTERRPDVLALADPPNRETFTAGPPRRLTYAEADRVVTAIATRLREMGLPTDAIIAVQLPHVVEHVLAMLAVLRAGMIVAPLPLLWRRADAVDALARIGAKALITSRRVGACEHARLAMQAALEVFSIRYVCAFGHDLPDGVVSLQDLFAAAERNAAPPLDDEPRANPAAHLAAVTFDVADGGVVPVARSHAELFAGGLGVAAEGRLAPGATILSTIAPASFAGMSLTLLPWLLSGGTLVLHHPFDADILAGQQREERCAALVVPGTVALLLSEAGCFADDGPRTVIAAWRSPERLALSSRWREAQADLIDVALFGEAGLVPARRGDDGRAAAVPLGPVTAPRDGGIALAELMRTPRGTLAWRGAMVPRHAFPPGSERGDLPCFEVAPDGTHDSGYACRLNPSSDTLAVTAAPDGTVNVGGCRLTLRDLQDRVRHIEPAASIAALPDPVLGQRLIGNARDRAAMRAALERKGLNPLVAAAFQDRTGRDGAAAAGHLPLTLTGR
jgi:hypothetical protein